MNEPNDRDDPGRTPVTASVPAAELVRALGNALLVIKDEMRPVIA